MESIPNNRFEEPQEVKVVVVADDVVGQLNERGVLWEPLARINGDTVALDKMPENKTGIVIGVGQNAPAWKEKGWQTVDIDPRFNADATADANYLEDVASQESQDFLYSERITFDRRGEKGVAPARLLQQANKVLKMGGKLIIETVNVENDADAVIPNRREFADLLVRHGFDVIIEVGKINVYDNGSKQEQRVVYHTQKIAEGYDTARQTKYPSLAYDNKTGLPKGGMEYYQGN